MGDVSRIKKVRNSTEDRTISIRYFEHEDLEHKNLENNPGWINVAPGSEAGEGQGLKDFRIPWCQDETDYNDRHIDVKLSNDPMVYCIWQYKDIDGDYIRCTVDGNYHSMSHDKQLAWKVHGDATVGADNYEIRLYWYSNSIWFVRYYDDPKPPLGFIPVSGGPYG